MTEAGRSCLAPSGESNVLLPEACPPTPKLPLGYLRLHGGGTGLTGTDAECNPRE